jgi:D-xylose transport system substrate-binding protein
MEYMDKMDQNQPDNLTEPLSPPAETPSGRTSGGKWVLFGLVGIAVIALLGFAAWKFMYKPAAAPVAEEAVRIGLSLDTVKIERWATERDIMAQKASKMGATLTTAIAEGNNDTQVSQIENFITQKVDVIIIVAFDANGLSKVTDEARAAGIKVINYDRLTLGSSPDLYISFDSVKVGKQAAQYVVDAIAKTIAVPNIAFVGGSTTDNNSYLVKEGAMSVLDPLVKSGKAKLVYDKFTTDWSPSEAYANYKKFLDGGGKADGVVTSYDGLAFGVVKALKERSLDGKVAVSGQNGELQAIQRIADGTQTMTAYKPGKPLAEKTVELAIDMAKGKKISTNGVTNNKKINVPSYLFDPIPVTKANINDTVIKDGTFTSEQIYNPSSTTE